MGGAHGPNWHRKLHDSQRHVVSLAVDMSGGAHTRVRGHIWGGRANHRYPVISESRRRMDRHHGGCSTVRVRNPAKTPGTKNEFKVLFVLCLLACRVVVYVQCYIVSPPQRSCRKDGVCWFRVVLCHLRFVICCMNFANAWFSIGSDSVIGFPVNPSNTALKF